MYEGRKVDGHLSCMGEIYWAARLTRQQSEGLQAQRAKEVNRPVQRLPSPSAARVRVLRKVKEWGNVASRETAPCCPACRLSAPGERRCPAAVLCLPTSKSWAYPVANAWPCPSSRGTRSTSRRYPRAALLALPSQARRSQSKPNPDRVAGDPCTTASSVSG